MSQTKGLPPIVYILLFLLLAGGGYWYFVLRNSSPSVNTANPDFNNPTATNNTTAPVSNNQFPLPASVPGGTVVRLDGSTSMVTINQNLKRGFEQQFVGTTVATQANGSNLGIQRVINGTADLAAVSRSLTAQEQQLGLVAVPVANDQIAIVVGNNNPLSQGLTQAQVAGIFQGQITNWSAVGAPAGTIRVINRPAVSGTHQTFREVILNGGNFGSSANFTTLDRDATTPLLRALNNDGIGYATYAQVANQQTVRAVAIDGTLPNQPNYPYSRTLYYVYKAPANQVVQAFLGYTTSPQGQQAMVAGN